MIAVHLAAAIMTAGTPEAAASPPVPLTWNAPAPCPEQEAVRAQVRRRLANNGEALEAVQLSMTVEEADAGFRLVARIEDATGSGGERVLQDETCEALTEAAVMIAAIALAPSLLPEPATAYLKPEPRSVRTPQPDRPSSATAETDPAPTPLVQLIDVSAGVGMGRLALGPVGLFRLGYGLERGRFRGAVRLSAMGPSVGRIDSQPGHGVFGAGLIGVAGCGRTRTAPWSLVGCVATDVGVAGGRGREVDLPRSNTSIWWGIEAEIGAEYAWSPKWAMTMRADASISPLQTRFVLDDQGSPCCERWGAGLRLGVLRRFGGD